MALTGDQINIITELIRKESSLPEVAAKWQSCYPDVRAIRVSELEMRYERPVIRIGWAARLFWRIHGRLHFYNIGAKPREYADPHGNNI
ncbi:hypothetical protein [Cupriavidus taiwanensis]|uniref:Uncharacterized protein n=1 Tax=Cupriavidus taiwanensis TaxID=164546 RepID=A0A375JAB8_9BURK|nr:hypothetical protein [Cupriavidus taiwanensis]SPS02125.1 hypothetical protein CBM2634_P100021 [Cupriavidus taiwanensis]